MAALVLTVLAFGPSIDAYVCRDEGIASVTAGSAADVAQAHADGVHTDGAHTEHGDGQGPCAHGHCHPVFFTSPLPAQIREARAVAQRPALPQASIVLSDLQFGLMRPPRA